jgi:hypothetical protein
VPALVLDGAKEMADLYIRQSGSRKPHLWVSHSADELTPLVGSVPAPRGDVRLLLLDDSLQGARREFLSALFSSILTPDTARLLPDHELAEVLSAENRNDLFVGGVVDAADRVLILYRGNLDRVLVPFDWFIGDGPDQPDFGDFELEDYGQTIRLGEYAAAGSAVLYDFDPDFRRRAKANELNHDFSFGASLRRLRLLRGVSREDFPGIAARTIARIERNEVEKPRGKTLRQIADRLGVRPDEIATY